MEIQEEPVLCYEIKDGGKVFQYTPRSTQSARGVKSGSGTSEHKTRKVGNENFTKKDVNSKEKCVRKQKFHVSGVAFRERKLYKAANIQTKEKSRTEYPKSGIRIVKSRDWNKTKFAGEFSQEQNVNSVKFWNNRRRRKSVTLGGGSKPQNSEDMCTECQEKMQKRLTLEWIPLEDMVTSQYRRECVIFPVYRCLVAAYCILVVISTAIVNNDDKIYIWFTYWALYFLTLSSILRAITAWCYNLYWKDEDGILYCKRMPVVLKFQWVLFNISTTVTTIICIIFWVSVYDPKVGPTAVSLNTHGVNLILIVIDAFISHQPVRFLHFLHSTVFCVVYAIFTLIYWAEGGTNYNNEPFIYAILDYSGNPGVAVLYASMVPLVAAPLCHSFHYFLYRLRTRIYRRCCLKSVNPRSQLDSTKDEKMLVAEVITTV